jgi:hypothetical protein
VQEASQEGGEGRGGGRAAATHEGLENVADAEAVAKTFQSASSASSRAACVRRLMVGCRSVNGDRRKESARGK